MKEVKIGLLGFGNVGSGTYEALSMNGAHIEKNENVKMTISKILVNNIDRERRIPVDKNLLTTDVNDILNDDSIDIVVEVLGGLEPATSYMLQALMAGKHVVTANKAAVAENYAELQAEAEKAGVFLKLEACVAGGIPILNPLTTVLKANQFEEILGILNGTTNYIMTQMSDFGLNYDDVLKDAQEKGFAEADPTADVEGIDAANKLSILMALAFGEYVHPKDIPTMGISKITQEEINAAKAEDKVIKLIAAAKNKDGELSYEVAPIALPKDHPLAGVKNEFNAVFVKGNIVDELMFYGKGAGPLPTGSAVLGDMLTIAKYIAHHA